MDLTDLQSTLRAELDDKTSARERSLSSARSAVRSCGNAIRAMHRYEMDSASTLLEEAQAHLDAARSALEGHHDMLHAGFVHDAEKEVAEARITLALVTGGSFPTPEGLG